MRILVVEDDTDIQLLIEAVFSMDSRFSLVGVAPTAEDALIMVGTSAPAIIVLDQGLAGPLTGLEAAPRLKELAPAAKVILFTAHAELREEAEQAPAVDAFLLKTDSTLLLPLARRLTGMDAEPDGNGS